VLFVVEMIFDASNFAPNFTFSAVIQKEPLAEWGAFSYWSIMGSTRCTLGTAEEMMMRLFGGRKSRERESVILRVRLVSKLISSEPINARILE